MSYQIDQARVERLAKNLSTLLSDLMGRINDAALTSEPIRKRILADLKAILDPIPPRDRGVIHTMLIVEIQKIFDEQGSPKVGFSKGCVGRDGFGVNATEGDVSVSVCGIGSIETGPTGGGIEGSFTY